MVCGIVIALMVLLVSERSNETEIELARILDRIFSRVSLNADGDYMEISRPPQSEWQVSCGAEVITKGSNFNCDVNIERMDVVLITHKLVGVI